MCLIFPAVVSAQNNSSTRPPQNDDLFQTKRIVNTRDTSVWYECEVNIGYGLNGVWVENGESYDSKFNRVIFETVHGVRITPYAFVGGGIALQYAYRDVKEFGLNAVVLPIFANIKGLIPVGGDVDGFTPYASLDLGYNLGIGRDDSYLNGLFGYFGLGFTVRHVNFAFGWEQRYFKYDDIWSVVPQTVKTKVGSLVFKLGARF